VPIRDPGVFVLFPLGCVRLARPSDEGVRITEDGKKELLLRDGETLSFSGRYAGRRKGTVPFTARRAGGTWSCATTAYMSVRLGPVEYSFVDADANGVFTEFEEDLCTEGNLGDLPPDARPDWKPVPGIVSWGGKRYLLSFDFPDGCRVCPVGDEVPDHAGPHNAYLNMLRAYAGFGPVGVSMKMYDAQVKHCLYMDRHGLCHAEDPSKEGYSAEGSRAGEMSVCGMGGSPRQAAEGMIMTLYHSYDYLHPKVRTVCYGFAKKKYSCHVDCVQGNKFMIYPYPWQDSVNPRGSSEHPDPYPQGAKRPGGTFIRFLPGQGKRPHIHSFRITDLLTGEEVKALFIDTKNYPPSVKQVQYEFMMRSVCLFPQKTLESNHVYKVDVVMAFGKRKRERMTTIFKVR
jgi:hypothetical protein